MSQPAKFMFEDSFDDQDSAPQQEHGAFLEQLQAQFESDLTASRDRARAQGREEGRLEAMESLEARLVECLNTLLESSRETTGQMKRYRTEIQKQAMELALATASRLSSELIARQPLANIENLIRETLATLPEVPRIHIFVPDDITDDLKARIEQIASASDFNGAIKVSGDGNIKPGDCRIEWEDGGVVRDREEIERAIAGAVSRHLDALESVSGAPQNEIEESR